MQMLYWRRWMNEWPIVLWLLDHFVCVLSFNTILMSAILLPSAGNYNLRQNGYGHSVIPHSTTEGSMVEWRFRGAATVETNNRAICSYKREIVCVTTHWLWHCFQCRHLIAISQMTQLHVTISQFGQQGWWHRRQWSVPRSPSPGYH